jgi:hypothetical protein
MPHYADGTEAKVGDQVYGKLYNTEGVRAGTLVSITPGVESCNALVGFLVAVRVGDAGVAGSVGDPMPRMSVQDKDRDAVRLRAVHGEQHGSAGPLFHLVECVDYCATNELTKIGP